MTYQEFRSIKVPLKSVLKDPDKDLAFFQQQSNNINIIVTLGYQFIRLYLLTLFHRNKPLPQINDILCKNVLSVICFPKTKRKDNTLINTLKIFYHASFKRLLPEDLVFDPANLSPICQSLATEMTTSLNNNIHIHFVDRLKRIIKYLIQQEPEFSEISKGQIRRGAAIVIDGLWEKDSEVFAESWEAGRELSNQLLTVINSNCDKFAIRINEIKGVIVYEGPGSYTGLRIGLSVVNSIGYSNQIPVVGVAGDDWVTKGLELIKTKKSFIPIRPMYGGEVRTTRPRK